MNRSNTKIAWEQNPQHNKKQLHSWTMAGIDKINMNVKENEI